MPDEMNAPARKLCGRAEVSRRRLPGPITRKRIWEAAQALDATERPISTILAKRFDLPAATVEAVLLSEGVRYERTATALRVGILNALEIAREAEGEDEWAAA